MIPTTSPIAVLHAYRRVFLFKAAPKSWCFQAGFDAQDYTGRTKKNIGSRCDGVLFRKHDGQALRLDLSARRALLPALR